MELANYKACICEGSAENAIMDILLDYNLLIFNREEMIEEEVTLNFVCCVFFLPHIDR